MVRDRVREDAERRARGACEPGAERGRPQARRAVVNELARGQLEQPGHAAPLRPAHEQEAPARAHHQQLEPHVERCAPRARARQLVHAPEGPRTARAAQRALGAARGAHGADARAELHQTLVPRARVLRAFLGRDQRARQLPAGLGQRARALRRLQREEPRQDALHVAVDQGLGASEGDREDRARRVGPDPGQRQPAGARRGEAPAELPHHHARRRAEGAGARVVAEAAPQREQLGLVGRRQGPHVRQARQEALVVGHDRLDARLLQHRLADPDRVGVARAPPGQVATLGAVPGQQRTEQRAPQRGPRARTGRRGSLARSHGR